MTRSTLRIRLVMAFVAAEIYQVFFGAMSSLTLGAPGVGDKVAWVPTILVDEALTILPIGFILCLWGSRWGRRLAAICAGASLVLALAASVALARAGGGSSVDPFGFPLGFALFAVPSLILAVYIVLMRSVSSREADRAPRP